MLKAWTDSGTGILKGSGHRSLESSIESVLLTPTIRELGTIAREMLEAIAAYPYGVKESRLAGMFPEMARVQEAADVFCKFSLVYRQGGFLKMLSPFRSYFLDSMQTLVYLGGSTDENTPNIHRDGVNSGSSSLLHQLYSCGIKYFEALPVDTHARHPQGKIGANTLFPSQFPIYVPPKPGHRSGTSLGARVFEKLRSAKKSGWDKAWFFISDLICRSTGLLALLRLTGGPIDPSHTQEGPASMCLSSPQQMSYPEIAPYLTETTYNHPEDEEPDPMASESNDFPSACGKLRAP